MVTEAVDVALAPPLEALLAPALQWSGQTLGGTDIVGNNFGKLQSTWLQLQVEESNGKYYLGYDKCCVGDWTWGGRQRSSDYWPMAMVKTEGSRARRAQLQKGEARSEELSGKIERRGRETERRRVEAAESKGWSGGVDRREKIGEEMRGDGAQKSYTVTIVAVDSRWVAAKGTLSETKQEHKHGRMCETPAERGAPIHGAGGASSPNQTKQTIGCPSGGKSRVVQGAPNGGNKYRPIRRPQDKCTGPKGWPGRQRKNIPFACRQVARPRGRCGGHGAPAECPTSPSQGAPLGGRHPQVAFGAAHRAQYVSKTHVQSFLIHC
eukprot:gene22605-biopygen23743